jgi:hypothetical protein
MCYVTVRGPCSSKPLLIEEIQEKHASVLFVE